MREHHPPQPTASTQHALCVKMKTAASVFYPQNNALRQMACSLASYHARPQAWLLFALSRTPAAPLRAGVLPQPYPVLWGQTNARLLR